MDWLEIKKIDRSIAFEERRAPGTIYFKDTKRTGVGIQVRIDDRNHRLWFRVTHFTQFNKLWSATGDIPITYGIRLAENDHIDQDFEGLPDYIQLCDKDKESAILWWGSREGVQVKCRKEAGNYVLYLKRISKTQKDVSGQKLINDDVYMGWNYRVALVEENTIARLDNGE